jgi:hypothetical protein
MAGTMGLNQHTFGDLKFPWIYLYHHLGRPIFATMPRIEDVVHWSRAIESAFRKSLCSSTGDYASQRQVDRRPPDMAINVDV